MPVITFFPTPTSNLMQRETWLSSTFQAQLLEHLHHSFSKDCHVTLITWYGLCKNRRRERLEILEIRAQLLLS